MVSRAFAIVNPEAPDYLAQFKVLEAPYTKAIQDRSGVSAYKDIGLFHQYQVFLSQQLNKADALLLKKLPKAQRQVFIQSQKRWTQYRDTEFAFIQNNWTQAQFGSSYVLSAGSFRCAIIRDRLMQIFAYLREY